MDSETQDATATNQTEAGSARPGNGGTARPANGEAAQPANGETAQPGNGGAAEETLAVDVQADEEAGTALGARVAELETALRERTNDVKRVQAEYVNYKRRVDRDRDVARNGGIESVVMDLLPVLDDLRLAQQHEEMTDGFKLLVEELGKITKKYGIQTYGEKGDPFDPQLHDAMMQVPMPGVSEPTCIEVLQVGYKFRDRVVRPARVAVGMPAEGEPPTSAAETTEGGVVADATEATTTAPTTPDEAEGPNEH